MSDKPLDCVGVDPAGEVGKHDFVLTERTPESKQVYFSGKIAELIVAQAELAAVTRERDALANALVRIEVSDLPDGSIVSTTARMFAAEILAKLESGELRKPDA